MMRTTWPIADSRIQIVDQFIEDINGWLGELNNGADVEKIIAEVGEHSSHRTKNKPKNLPPDEDKQYDDSKEFLDQLKKEFTNKIKDSLARQDKQTYAKGLSLIAPYANTLADLVEEFSQRYKTAKQAQAAVDFHDLQRYAYDLLQSEENPGQPSEVARQLQNQYAHVLVDEFQDIDPLQEAILRLVSSEHADPPQGNLFTVGDVKQSIYRFRLAEPKLFIQRAQHFDTEKNAGQLIPLQENFRSRVGVIDAVNFLFQDLMSQSFGGSDYGEREKLYAGLDYPPDDGRHVFGKPAVEFHLLEPITQTTQVDNLADNGNDSGNDDDLELEAIEREAYLIGRRIKEFMGENPQKPRRHIAAKNDAGSLELHPVKYGDMVILLRSGKYKAEPLADILRRMGIPVRLERGENQLESTEFSDCLSLMRILDNRQQDIPLAAVLRSPLLQDRFDEDDLLEIRLLNKNIPFYEAVAQYAHSGPDVDLRQRVQDFLARLDYYRQRIRRAPVCEVLWEIFETNHYLAYVAGLPDGTRRREHLLRLHELSRQFSHFSRQGLRRFLRFLDDLLENKNSFPQPPAASTGDDVVRIMTIHQSKGLEFPVVFLANLSNKFNLNDLRREVLIDREWGIALKAADPEKRITYPTLIQQLAAEHATHESLSEELRILYVAMTRAREHLELIGVYNLKNVESNRNMAPSSGQPPVPLSAWQIESANNMLDWLVPVICRGSPQHVQWADQQQSQNTAHLPLFRIHTYDRAATDQWQVPQAVADERTETLQKIADLQPLDDTEPIEAHEKAEALINALDKTYLAEELTSLPARVAVSELKRRWDTARQPEDYPLQNRYDEWHPPQPNFLDQDRQQNAAERGTATHSFLQHLDFHRPCDRNDLQQQLSEMIDAGRLPAEDAKGVMLDAVAWFFTTDLGRRIHQNAAQANRELAFISRINPEDYEPGITAAESRDVLLVRGMIDLVLDHESGLEILDYKTDAVEPIQCPERAESYRPQLELYARALSDICKRQVTDRWLVFLHAREIIHLPETKD